MKGLSAFQAVARVAITAGGLVAERMMRAREQAMLDWFDPGRP